MCRELDYKELLIGLVNAIDGLTGHNLPSAYDGDDDDAGHCPYCRGWNMDHEKTCEAVKAETVAKRANKLIIKNKQ